MLNHHAGAPAQDSLIKVQVCSKLATTGPVIMIIVVMNDRSAGTKGGGSMAGSNI